MGLYFPIGLPYYSVNEVTTMAKRINRRECLPCTACSDAYPKYPLGIVGSVECDHCDGRGVEPCEVCHCEDASEVTDAGLYVCRECADELALSYAAMPRINCITTAARGVNLRAENDR